MTNRTFNPAVDKPTEIIKTGPGEFVVQSYITLVEREALGDAFNSLNIRGVKLKDSRTPIKNKQG